MPFINISWQVKETIRSKTKNLFLKCICACRMIFPAQAELLYDQVIFTR